MTNEAFPYQNVALDWLSQPEQNAAMTIHAMEQVIASDKENENEDEMTRFRHTAAFVYRIATLIPPHARPWPRGWSAAYTHAAFARAVGLTSEG